MNTGAKIKLYRILAGMTQQELSEVVKTEPTYLVRYERGPIEPPTKIIFKLCQELGVEPRWLVEASAAPYVLLTSAPVKEGMTARQISGIQKALQETIPAFLENVNVDAFCKIGHSTGTAYCFAFHAKDNEGKLIPDGSVLIITLPDDLAEGFDQLLAAQSSFAGAQSPLKDQMFSSVFIQLGEDARSKGEKRLQATLDRLRRTGAEWIDIGECLKAWRQRLDIKGKRTEWNIPVSFTVTSREKISREEAALIIEKMVLQFSSPEALTISIGDKKPKKG